MPNTFSGGMPTGQNAEGRNADIYCPYCPISGGMPKTEVSRNESVSTVGGNNKMPLIVFVVRERLLLGRFGGYIGKSLVTEHPHGV